MEELPTQYHPVEPSPTLAAAWDQAWGGAPLWVKLTEGAFMVAVMKATEVVFGGSGFSARVFQYGAGFIVSALVLFVFHALRGPVRRLRVGLATAEAAIVARDRSITGLISTAPAASLSVERFLDAWSVVVHNTGGTEAR